VAEVGDTVVGAVKVENGRAAYATNHASEAPSVFVDLPTARDY
jgi:hypothetical protein